MPERFNVVCTMQGAIQVLCFFASKTVTIGTVNFVAEHFRVVTMCSTTKFTVPIFAVFDV